MSGRLLIEIEYTDDELAAYGRVVERERSSGSQGIFWGMIASGFVVALLGAFGARYVGAATPGRVDVVAVLILAGFFLGLWSPAMWYYRVRMRLTRALTPQASVLIAEGGLFTRLKHGRAFFARQAIVKLTSERGLLFIWLREGGKPLAIPLRLLDGEAKARLASMAPKPA
ncbi:MAG: hypothetical protein ABSC22_11210 [Roseiarcus sp.]|jgi:hypothetical protein